MVGHGALFRLTIIVAAGVMLVATVPARAQSEKTVTIVEDEEPVDMDACSAPGSFTGRIIHHNVVESLTELRPDGSIEPRLATSWKQQDPNTWRFQIREGVTFHDGTRLNADAVVRALERVVGATFTCVVKDKYFSNFKIKARKAGEYAVDLVSDTPWPIMPLYASGMAIPSPNTPMDKLVLNPVGTGPYVFDHWTQQQEIVLNRNKDWRGKKNLPVERVRYVFRKESSVRAAMVAVGEADIAPSISQNDAVDPKTDTSYANAEVAYMRVDTAVTPLNDVRVRKALNYAIDRDAIIKAFFPKGAQPATQIYGPSIAGYNVDIDKRVWPYDPGKAKQLLAAAKADGVAVDREIELQGRIGLYATAQEVMEALQQYYKAVGLNVRLKMYDLAGWRSLHNKPYAEGRGPALLQNRHDNATGDAIFSILYKHTCAGSTSTYCDPDLDKRIDKSAQMMGEERIKAFQEIGRYLYEDAVESVHLAYLVGFGRVGSRVQYKPNVLTNSLLKIEDITFR